MTTQQTRSGSSVQVEPVQWFVPAPGSSVQEPAPYPQSILVQHYLGKFFESYNVELNLIRDNGDYSTWFYYWNNTRKIHVCVDKRYISTHFQVQIDYPTMIDRTFGSGAGETDPGQPG